MKLIKKSENMITFGNKKGKQIIIWMDASGNVIVESKKGKKTTVHKVFMTPDSTNLVDSELPSRIDDDSEE